MHTLYSMQDSGNCYKLRLVMAQLDIPFRLVDIDILKGESRTPEFLEINPNGRVPTLVLDDGRPLPESNAAMWYLAEASPLLSDDRYARAQILQWMFFEQYSHEPYIAVARFWLKVKPGGRAEKSAAEIAHWQDRGHQALAVMDTHLGAQDYFAGDRYSIADIALYAYTHMAGDGEFDLSPYDNVRQWLDRIAAEPGHVTIDWRP
ncbi:MAG: glutathione S-transferase family protein [Hyphomicrobiales bacterium]